MRYPFYVLIVFALSLCGTGTVAQTAEENDYPIHPVPFTSIELADSFWLPRIRVNHQVTIPHSLIQSENRLDNFRIAAGLQSGTFQSSYPFDDTDIYKIIEAASYSIYYNPDPALEAQIDDIISIIALAQEPDGYLYTARTIGQFPAGFVTSWLGDERWEKVHDLSHELYNLGHLFEAACAYYEATGKENLLQIAVKAADLLDATFGWGKLETYPGHQIVEVGLARLYRVTGDRRYLDLAKFFLDVRGPGGPEYCQAHLPVVDQTTAVGHAVRAVYMYAGMADVAALFNDVSYINAIGHIWDDLVTKKIYVTGGLGASGGNEGFDAPYNLPNSSAYCETCASIGNIYLNHRLFLMHGHSKYIDILERTLYNSLLSGVSLSGDRFFYPNRLASSGGDNRSVWFGCACCPPNIAKLIPSVPGYIYAHKQDTLYVNLFISDTARFDFEGSQAEIIQSTDYPWGGDVNIEVNPSASTEFTIMVRIPGWARGEAITGNLYSFTGNSAGNVSISLNGIDYPFIIHNGYAVISRVWTPGDRVSLSLPMEPQKVIARDEVVADRDRFAVQRGPVVYCAEGVDNSGSVGSFRFDLDEQMESRFDESLLNGIPVITLPSKMMDGSAGDEVTLIPYSYWNNRGASPMQVWLSEYKELNIPDSLIVVLSEGVATTNHVSSWEDLTGIYDLYDPVNSADKGTSAFGNWTSGGTTIGVWNWVEYSFEEPKTISSSEVYWWRDGAGINIPDSSFISYYDETAESFVRIDSTLRWDDDICPDRYNYEFFGPVTTRQIRLNFFDHTMAQGILEWKVYSPGIASSVRNNSPVRQSLNIYPNPVVSQFSVGLDTPGNAIITVFNSSGQLLYRSQFTDRITLSRSDIGGKGIYHINVMVNGAVYHKKVVFL
ncbi:MAG: beta-L-arabinofuranosidase domain-containing protein [Bacteroidales bacterium]